MEKTIEVQAAEWLVVGFTKCWTMQMLSEQLYKLGGGKHFDFMPTSRYWYGKCPVRGFVEQNWPKLNSFLCSAPPEKQLAAAAQIVKLRPKVERPGGALTKTERNEIAKTKKDLRGSTTAYNESRKNFIKAKSNNWNVCS